MSVLLLLSSQAKSTITAHTRWSGFVVCCTETRCLQGEQVFFFSTGLHEYLAFNASFANAAMHCFTDACVYTDTHPAINLTPLRFF